MERGIAVALALLGLAGCVFPSEEFQPTPCSPPGRATYGTLLVRFPPVPSDEGLKVAGTCVALKQGDHTVATARFAADGNATLNVPVSGPLYVSWVLPTPQDHACAFTASSFLDLPGPTNVTLEYRGRVCH